MKIYGVGADIIKISRIKSSIKKNLFIRRIFDEKEILRCKKQNKSASCFAKRFAAKESLVKALGTGFRDDINFKDIEILNNNLGKPYYIKSKKINSIIKKKFKINRYNLFLSISDEKNYSTAFTILQNWKC